MNSLKLAFITIFMLLSLLILHKFGVSNHLYLNIWYYDIIAHFLGGIGLALSIFYILKDRNHIITLTFVLGIIWELYEIYFGLTGHPVGSFKYLLDTIKDLIIDILGAMTVWFFVNRNKVVNI